MLFLRPQAAWQCCQQVAESWYGLQEVLPESWYGPQEVPPESWYGVHLKEAGQKSLLLGLALAGVWLGLAVVGWRWHLSQWSWLPASSYWPQQLPLPLPGQPA